MTEKKCVVCGVGPREVPDRESTSRAKRVCRPCHGKRLQGDLKRIIDFERNLRRNRV
jgi:hypothetical protein